MLLLLSVIPAAVVAEAIEPVADPHSGHITSLKEILTGTDCATDFCGRFYCEDCRETYYAPITCDDIGIPIVNIKGSLDGISKDVKVNVNIDYSSADM